MGWKIETFRFRKGLIMDSYIRANNVLAIGLVGGKGSRLGPLTIYRTKPAVMAGPAILASFSTSAALNSGVDRIVLASQYLPFSLEKFYSDVYGSEFGHYKKIDVIGPHHYRGDETRYKGTADAFYKALQIGVKHQREYVLGLSGDHIYTFDFEKLFGIFLEKYEKNAFIVFTQKVSRADAPRFGILETEKHSTKVTKFIEKPSPSQLPPDRDSFDASMGIYFASLRVWQRILEEDQRRGAAGESNYDIGGDVIPHMIETESFPVHVFRFEGFWADVGEPKALYETYRSIFLKRNPDLFGDRLRPIASIGQPNFFSSDDCSFFTSGKFSTRQSRFNGSIFSPGVELEKSEVLDSIIMGESEGNRTTISQTLTNQVIIDKMCNIKGAELISDNGIIIVVRGTMIANGVKIHPKGNAVVASLSTLTENIQKLETYVKTTQAELYDNFGTKYTFNELLDLKKD